MSLSRALPITLPKITSMVGQRSATRTEQVTAQFKLESDTRYQPGDGKTWCNIWAWDWSCAMGAEIPHWVDAKDMPCKPFAPGGRELSANSLADWFTSAAAKALGWSERRATASVVAEVNAGNVAIAIVAIPGGHGHITPIVPDKLAIHVAHVGSNNRQRCTLAQAFGVALAAKVRFWVHA